MDSNWSTEGIECGETPSNNVHDGNDTHHKQHRNRKTLQCKQEG